MTAPRRSRLDHYWLSTRGQMLCLFPWLCPISAEVISGVRRLSFDVAGMKVGKRCK
jgi:hypothetical protein